MLKFSNGRVEANRVNPGCFLLLLPHFAHLILYLPTAEENFSEASFKEDRNLWWVCNILTSQVRILISHEIGLEGIEINISNTRLESSSSSQLFDPNVLLGIGIFYEHVVD